MLVTLFGIVTLVSPLHPLNANLPMLVTLPSVGIALVLQPTTSSFFSVSIMQFPEE